MDTAPAVAIAYHSGYGHTAVLAEAVHEGAAEEGVTVRSLAVDVLTEEDWAVLDAADAIIFGAPTYMGSASAAFHAFAEASSGRWSEQSWSEKFAAGFTNSGAMSGDKLCTLHYFTILAAQHGMHWISLGLLPGWNTSAGSEHDLNRLGIQLGAGAQSNNDQGIEAVTKADVETARHLGRRVARTVARCRPVV